MLLLKLNVFIISEKTCLCYNKLQRDITKVKKTEKT